LSPSRPWPENPEETSADAVSIPGGSRDAASDKLYDASIKLVGLERTAAFLEAHMQTADGKLDKIIERLQALETKIAAAEGSLGTLKWIGKAIGAGVWGLIAVFLAMWAKHRFGW